MFLFAFAEYVSHLSTRHPEVATVRVAQVRKAALKGVLTMCTRKSMFNVCGVRGCGWVAVLGAVLCASTASFAQNMGPVTRVEEDWELVLLEPDGDLLAPQFHTVISPFGHLDDFYAQTTWNYQELPIFRPGGFQVQGWQDERVVNTKSFDLAEFSRTSETVVWTQVVETNETWTAFALIDGASVTWGGFGGIFTVVSGFHGMPNLDTYSPNVSVENSWITYGANRVTSLKIVEVRYYDTDGLLYTDTTQRAVFPVETAEE